jgi:hypothetical protein
VETTGYASAYDIGFTEDVDAIREVDAARAAFGPAYESKLYGDGGQQLGCEATAREQLFMNVGGLTALPEYQKLVDLQAESSERLYASDAGRRVVDSWASCMAESGYDFDSWFEARDRFPHPPGETGPVSEEEIDQARRDAACRSRVELEAELLRIETEIQLTLVEQNQPAFEAYNATLRTILDRVAQVA